MWLDPIPASLHGQARAALEAGNALGFLMTAGQHHGIELVSRNVNELYCRGIYEEALLGALIGAPYNYSFTKLKSLFQLADRKRLRELSDPLPGKSPWTIYRGIAGRGRQRRVYGLSWTLSFDIAEWFARRHANVHGLEKPCVISTSVTRRDILAYLDESHRSEQEVLALVSRNAALTRKYVSGDSDYPCPR